MGKASLSRGNYENYCKDKSIKEIFEDELDAVIERLMNAGGAADGRDPGRGESLAWCIAVIENPYAPNMDDVKGRAMLRYEASLLESIPEEPSSGFEEEANFTTTDYSAEHVE